MNAAHITQFVIGVCGELPGRQALETAAEMARMFRARFSALMIEDPASGTLGYLPFAREYVPGRAAWQNIGVADVEARRASAQRRVRDAFATMAQLHGLNADVEVLSGNLQDELTGALHPGDIVALLAPAQASEWMTLPFSAFAEAAFQGPATALLLPSRIARRKGPVVALTNMEDKASLSLAARLAQVSGEMLIVMAAGVNDMAGGASTLSELIDFPLERLRIIDVDGANLRDIKQWLWDIEERMLVVGRELLTEPGLGELISLASARGIPVLIPGNPAARQED